MQVFSYTLYSQLYYLHPMKNTYFSVDDSSKYQLENECFFPKYNIKTVLDTVQKDVFYSVMYKEHTVFTDSLRPNLYKNTFLELYQDTVLFITFFDNHEIFNYPATVYRNDCFIIKYSMADTIYSVDFEGKRIMRNDKDLKDWNKGYDTTLVYAIDLINFDKLTIRLKNNNGDVEVFYLNKFLNPYSE